MSRDRFSKAGLGLLRDHSAQIIAATVLSLYYVALTRHMEPSGDERWYLAVTPLLKNLFFEILRFDWSAANEELDLIVHRGWYMPGMSLVVLPATWFVDSIESLRIYMGLLNFALVCGILGLLRQLFGVRAPAIFLGCTLTIPYYALYSFVIWGDLLGAQLFLLGSLLLIKRIRDAGSEGIPIGVAACFGVGLAITTYIRGFYWLALPLLLVGFFFSTSAQASLRARLRHLGLAGGAATLAFALLLAPWSSVVSQRFGFHLTTTSLPISQIIAFGSNEYVNSTRLEEGASVFEHLHEHILRRAHENGTTYRAQAREELAKATADATIGHFVRVVLRNCEAYYLDSETFMKRFRRTSRSSERAPPLEWRERAYDLLQPFNHWAWRALLVVGIGLFLLPVGPEREKLYLSTFFKYTLFVFSIQPFVVFAHGRYYVQYVPFIATALAVFVAKGRSDFRPRWPTNVDEGIVLAGQGIALVFATGLLACALVIWMLPANG